MAVHKLSGKENVASGVRHSKAIAAEMHSRTQRAEAQVASLEKALRDLFATSHDLCGDDGCIDCKAARAALAALDASRKGIDRAALSAPKGCHLCERGFPKEGGQHYGTQSLGMIPTTQCELADGAP